MQGSAHILVWTCCVNIEYILSAYLDRDTEIKPSDREVISSDDLTYYMYTLKGCPWHEKC